MATDNDRDERHARNKIVMDEFRANNGMVEGRGPLLILHSVGAKSGEPRVNPMMFMEEGDNWLVFASKGGLPKSPDWYFNLVANPEVKIEVGPEFLDVRAQVLTGAERDAVYAKQASEYPIFAEYQSRTERTIPVIRLSKR